MALMETLLVFFFGFAVVYGALGVSDVFKNRRVSLVIALVIGAFAAMSPAVVGFITGILPYALIFFVAFFFLGFIVTFFRGKDKKPDYSLMLVIGGLALLFFTSGEPLGIDLEGVAPWAILGIIALIFLAAFHKQN